MSRLGAVAGGLLFVVLARLGGAPPWLVVAVPAVNLLGFLTWGWISARWRGRRRYVLLEHGLLAAGAMIGLAAAAPVSVAMVADAWMAAMALTLGVGRVGCLLVGCCHGRVARVGVRYPWLPPWILGERWAAVRVFPLQAIEALLLVALAVAGVALALTTRGWSATVVPAAYAVGRFELELWRGDVRRYIGRLSHNQWSCLVVVGLTAVRPIVALVGAGLIAVVVVVQWKRLQRPAWSVGSPRDLGMIEAVITAALAGTPGRLGETVVSTDGRGELELSALCGRVDRDLLLIASVAAKTSTEERTMRDRA